MTLPSNKSAGEDGGKCLCGGRLLTKQKGYACDRCAYSATRQQPAADIISTNLSSNKIVNKTESVKLCYHANPTYCNDCFSDLERQLKIEREVSAQHANDAFDLSKQVRELKENIEFLRKELSKPKDDAPF